MLQVEQVLQNRYKLQRQLSDSGVRQTWFATDLAAPNSEKSQVVVKLLAFGGTVQWEDLKLFEREAQILKQLNHPRIPKYVDYFCIDERSLWFCLVQEYIPGESLKDKLATGQRFTEKQVRTIAQQILHILIYLHDLSPSVLHRDIKPSNLVWGEGDRVYLVDFGAVQDKAAKEGVTFTVVGTYGYAPMEQFGGRATPASDLYALGATLIHLLTGIAPADLPVRDLQIQFQDKLNISTSLVYWLEQLIQPSLEQRIPSAKEALTALKANRLPHTILGTVSKPLNSGIQLQKSAKQLFVKLPMQPKSRLVIFGFSLKLLFVTWLGLILVGGSLTFLFMLSPVFGLGLLIVLWLMWLTVIDKLILYSWGHQRVYFTPEYFAVELWLFNFCRHKIVGRTADIQDVFQSVLQTGKTTLQLERLIEKEMVTIQTGQKRYSFGVGLSAMECLWLANQIKDWLRLNCK